MWLDIILWILLIVMLLWVIKKSNIFLKIAEASSRSIYTRLSPEEKVKFDKIAEEESLKEVDNDQNHSK